jgi:hypothetical protein
MGSSKKKMGRPTKLTTVTKRRLLAAFRTGSTIERACGAAGILPASYYNWMNRGEAAKSGIYLEFFDDVKKAQEFTYQKALGHISDAMAENWTAAAWYLERRHRKEFGKNDYLQFEIVRPPKVVEEYTDPWLEEDDDDDDDDD